MHGGTKGIVSEERRVGRGRKKKKIITRPSIGEEKMQSQIRCK